MGAGFNALNRNTTGQLNTAVGSSTLQNNTTGTFNTVGEWCCTGQQHHRQQKHGRRLRCVAGQHSFRQYRSWGAGSFRPFGLQQHATGSGALRGNLGGNDNTALGSGALFGNTSGDGNTAVGKSALDANSSGTRNTALGWFADVGGAALLNATAIGASAIVDASNKIRLGDPNVTVIEGQVAYTFSSDATKKEKFRLVDGDKY